MDSDIPNPRDDSLLGPVLLLLLVHSIIPLALCCVFFTVVPKFVEIFKSFGTELPALTQAVIRIGSVAWHYVFVAPFLFAGFLTADALIYCAIRRSHGRSWARTWWGGVFAAEAVALVLMVVALFLPLIALMTQVGQQAGGQ